MKQDQSNGYDAIARDFLAHRQNSRVGVETVRAWSQTLPPGSTILDLGCGNGIPMTQALVNGGFSVCGVDASPTLVQSYREHFPGLPVACEPVETSSFFGRKFDGVLAWGLLFLLPKRVQEALIHRAGAILNPGGQFLFTSPQQACTWVDVMTGLASRSLGADRYQAVLASAGLCLAGTDTDEGENHYYLAKKEGPLSQK